MELARVVGTIVSTAKDAKLNGKKLLLVNIIEADQTPTKTHVVAVDTVGAGVGEVVILVRGSSARQAGNMSSVPTDTSIIAIIDSIEKEGKLLFQKSKSK